jgi:hypothetical protein
MIKKGENNSLMKSRLYIADRGGGNLGPVKGTRGSSALSRVMIN